MATPPIQIECPECRPIKLEVSLREIKPGSSINLGSISEFNGYASYAIIVSNTPDVELSILVDGSEFISLNPSEAESYMIKTWMNMIPSSLAYDPDRKLYVTAWSPSPWPPIRGDIEAKIWNRSKTIAIVTAKLLLYERIIPRVRV